VITTLLLDLDDTLIGNEMDEFIPTYLSLLSGHNANLVPPDIFTRTLLSATMNMTQNDDPEITLEGAFAANFYPKLGVSETDLRDTIADFYANRYPELRPLIGVRPSARTLIDQACQQGLEIVIATNPLFPMTAITQRMGWGHIGADNFPYALITSYESFHFCKPNIAYYAEVLGRLGRRTTEAVMVGNDPENDLEPAKALGLPVFHIADQPEDPFRGGSLDDVLQWLENEAPHLVNPDAANQPSSVLARLKGHLGAFLSMLSSLDDESWTGCPRSGEWSPVEIVCHLRDVELEVNQPRIQAVLDQQNPFVHAADPDAWAAERAYASQPPLPALQAFVDARKETISRLEAIDSGEWLRPARHALFGPTTLREIAAIIADHDLRHLTQLRACLDADIWV
jgi:FMN phosphatase YigB (HAD superfamily)